MSKISKTTFTMKDAKRLARNVGGEFQDQAARIQSLAICFDALISVLDAGPPVDGVTKVSDQLKAELERRKQMNLPKVENANPASNE